jgi:hypothetical protein
MSRDITINITEGGPVPPATPVAPRSLAPEPAPSPPSLAEMTTTLVEAAVAPPPPVSGALWHGAEAGGPPPPEPVEGAKEPPYGGAGEAPAPPPAAMEAEGLALPPPEGAFGIPPGSFEVMPPAPPPEGAMEVGVEHYGQDAPVPPDLEGFVRGLKTSLLAR